MLGIKTTNGTSLYKSNPQGSKEMYIPLHFDIDINACFERVSSTLNNLLAFTFIHLIETYKKKKSEKTESVVKIIANFKTKTMDKVHIHYSEAVSDVLISSHF